MIFRVLIVLLITFSNGNFTSAQCPTCPASCITSTGTGNWDDCLKWSGVSCVGWSTATIMGNRKQVIQTGHVITIPSTVTSFHARSNGVYVNTGGVLNVSGAINGNSYGATVISVSGTINYTSGNSNFDGSTLTVCDGGVLNISGGQLKVSTIIVKSGGTINISGSGDLARTNRPTGLVIEAGGTININSTTAKLSEIGTIGTRACTIDGTLDVKNSMTSSNQGNVALGDVSVTNGTSTGRIRTQTAFLPSHTTTVPSSSANDFFASNSDYGGTVEYYGSAITLNSTWSRNYYYDLDINTNVTLISETFVRGTLKLRGGNLILNGKKLNIIGTISYLGTNFISGDVNAEIEFRGKLSTNNSFVSPGMTTYLINSFGVANVNCKNPQLRMSSAPLGSANLKTLTINREDVVYVDYSRITINTLLDLKRGIFRTSDSEQAHLYVSLDDSVAVKHATTGTISLSSYVSGFLKRKISSGKTFDFPVGYVNQTEWVVPSSCSLLLGTSTDKHRRISFEINSMGVPTQDLAVRFFNPIDDECTGTLSATQFSSTLLSIHPEGYWLSVPSAPLATVSYNTRLYVQGFSGLTDNYFYTVKRPETTPTCSAWSTYGLPVPSMNQTGRIKVQDSGVTCLQSGYAKRMNHTEFSHHAIAFSSVALPIELNFFNAECEGERMTFYWQTNSEHNNDFFLVQKSLDLKQWETISEIDGTGNSTEQQDYSFVFKYENAYYRLVQVDFNGVSTSTDAIFIDCSIEELIVSPNPTNKALFVQLKNHLLVNSEMRIISLDGRVVWQGILMNNISEINIESLDPGVYYFVLSGLDGVIKKKILKL